MLIGLYYIFIPLLLIGVIAYKRQPNKLFLFMNVLSFGLAILFLWATSRWEIVSVYFRIIFPVLFVLAVAIGYRRIRKPKNPPKRIAVVFVITIHLVLIIFFSGLNWFTYSGYRAPNNAIELSSPFRSGKQIVLNGGKSPFINGHYHVRPQNYALDLVGLNKWGMRSQSISGGRNLENYIIYGETVYSPIDGVVSLVRDGLPDLEPPLTDTDNLAGNFVLIEQNGFEILLAHLKNGSITVKVGDEVRIGTQLGEVGNTGNTSEPHLHIHIEKGGSPGTILDGEAVPFTINDRFLKRGSILKYSD